MSSGLSYKECIPWTTMEEANNVLRVTEMSILENAEIESLLNEASKQVHKFMVVAFTLLLVIQEY